MKLKKIISAICASALLLSTAVSNNSLFSAKIIYAETGADETADDNNPEITEEGETGEEPAPDTLPIVQNLRYEDGFIKWDKVEEAYGYILRIHLSENGFQEFAKYFDYDNAEDDAKVEFDRLCYENYFDLGEYAVDVCVFDKAQNRGEWSDTVNVKYEPTLTAPANFRFSETQEETVEWDEVEGAYRYNIRIHLDGDNSTTYTYTDFTSFGYKWYIYDNGDYLISIQTMDQDYNVSPWTEPLIISYDKKKLETPQNIRFDESGENILWDEVEGAEYYYLSIFTPDLFNENGSQFCYNDSVYITEPSCMNWKSYAAPFSEGEYFFTVTAHAEDKIQSNQSEEIRASFKPTFDEAVSVPEVRLEESLLKWENNEGSKRYWLTISVNGRNQEINGSYCCDKFNADDYDVECTYSTSPFPLGDYNVSLYVVDENNKYNKKTFSFTFGQSPDQSIWVPEMRYKINNIFWDYDQLRHDNTDSFWVRVRNANDDAIVFQQKLYNEYFTEFWSLDNGEYTLEVCAYAHDENWNYKFGSWYQLKNIEKHDESGFDKENESTEEIIVPPEIEETIPEEDRITSITINPAFNMKHKDGDDVELDISKIKIKAEEIYDEEGLKRVEEALGEEIKPNQQCNLLDLTLLYDGEDFSNGYEGLVKVIIPIPTGHRDKNFTVYRLTEIDGKMTKEVIPGEQTEDSYIIYLEHFSEYALIGEEPHTHSFSEDWKHDADNHWKECQCGEKAEVAEHEFGDWAITKEATEAEAGLRERACEVCGYVQTEEIAKLPHSFSEDWKCDADNHWKECQCGEKAETANHDYGEWKVTKAATESETGEQERECLVCGYKQTEVLPKLTPSTPPKTETTDDNPNMGVTALDISAIMFAVCGAGIIFASKKKKQ